MHLSSKILFSEHTLIQYIRDKKRQPVGVLIADQVPNPDGKTFTVHVGWSRCNFRDRFEKDKGLKLAFGRMCKNRFDNVPHSMKAAMTKFLNRCERYYKQPVAVN